MAISFAERCLSLKAWSRPLDRASIPRYNFAMSRSAAEILEDARQLPPAEVDWLIESLLIKGDGGAEPEIEAAWDSEIKRRLDEIDSGAVKMIPGEQVRAEILAALSPQARARLCA